VDPKADLIKVSVAKEWKESRADCEFIDKMVHPFDWTFTTPYKGIYYTYYCTFTLPLIFLQANIY
jgi:hypothetical protein